MSADALVDLDCGISPTRIISWLDSHPACAREGDAWVFPEGESACLVEATPLDSRDLGHVRLERTRLVARGDAAAVAAFERAFTLRFMSAGG